MAARKSLEERLQDYDREYRELAATLAELGYVYNGTVLRQWLTCGNKRCACYQDKNRRHGPYVYWTTKVKGRTVSRLLSPEEAELYTQWVKNRRSLEKTKRRMFALSKKMGPLILKKRRLEA